MSSMPNQDTVLHSKQSALACRGQLANGMLIKPALVQHYAQIGVLLDNLELLMRVQERVCVKMAKTIEDDNLGFGL